MVAEEGLKDAMREVALRMTQVLSPEQMGEIVNNLQAQEATSTIRRELSKHPTDGPERIDMSALKKICSDSMKTLKPGTRFTPTRVRAGRFYGSKEEC